MSNYLLIESRDPFDSNDVQHITALAASLKRNGDAVTLFLVQNGVLAARKSPAAAALTALAQQGVTVLADEFALKERGITGTADGIKPAKLDVIVDRLEAGDKAMWH
jgi:sulfur relay (sulfurtransferase) complex TusBCD TusD component (DsrE family)